MLLARPVTNGVAASANASRHPRQSERVAAKTSTIATSISLSKNHGNVLATEAILAGTSVPATIWVTTSATSTNRILKANLAVFMMNLAALHPRRLRAHLGPTGAELHNLESHSPERVSPRSASLTAPISVIEEESGRRT